MRWAVKSGVLVLGLGAFLGNPERAGAAYVEYTMTSSASGTLGGKVFTDASITITGIGDTARDSQPILRHLQPGTHCELLICRGLSHRIV